MVSILLGLQVASPSIGEADDEQLSEPGTPRFATPAKGRKGDLCMTHKLCTLMHSRPENFMNGCQHTSN